MRYALIAVSVLSLCVAFAAPALHAMGEATDEISRLGMLIGTAGWFATAPFWIGRSKSSS